ncbi:hypothetical protein M514_01761 [Trichuris suis]|uniref:Srp40 C-terminal domain-containing protein n=1 Tax=Trichuris suis TaxID=68888 RepID=A0A085NT44_9BILA|nr:hypothetical protein M513_01761 [Trichuris suis]KFD72640.1 hypothetical protein M514_01761 [Trichuris suis]
MDSLQLTHSLVHDFLVKEFGPKVASKVYKSKIKSPSNIDGELVDLEAFVRENYATSVSRKRKLDGTSPADTKKARVADKQQDADGHPNSSSESSSDDDSEVDHESGILSKAKPSAVDARSVPAQELSTSSTSDSSEVENGKTKGDTKIAPNQIAKMPAAKRADKATVLAAEESDSSTDSAPAIVKNVSTTPARASPAQQKRSAASRDGDSKGAAVSDAAKKGAAMMTPRSCVIGKQPNKTVSNKESVSSGKNVATRKSVTLSTTAKRVSPAAEETSDSSDDSSSSEAVPVKKLTSGLLVEKKNQQSSSSDSSSEEESVNDKEKVVHPKQPLTSKSNLRVSGEGRQLNDKAVSGKGKPVKQVAPQTSSSSESSSSDESAVKTGATKVMTRSAGKIINNKPASSSDESSSEDDGSDEIQNNVTVAPLAKAGQPQQDESSSSDSSSTEEDVAIGTQKPLISSEKKVDHRSIAQQVAKQKTVSTSSSDSSSSEDEPLPERKPLSKGLANVEVKKNKKSVEEFIKQAEQDVSSSSESSSSEEDSSQSGKQQVKVSKKVEQSTLKQKTKAAVAGGVVDKSSSTSSESMDELTLQLKDKLAGSSFSEREKKTKKATKGSTTPMAKTALKFSPSNDVSKKVAGVKKQNVTPKSKQAVQEDTSSSSSEEDLVPKGKGFDSSFGKVQGPGGKGNLKKTAPMPVRQEVQKDSSSGDSSTSDEDILEKKKTLTSSARKEETSKTSVGVKRNVPLVSKQNLAEVSSSSSSESSSDEDLSSIRKEQVQQGACKKASNQLVTDGQKSSAGTNVEKKQLTSKTVKMTSGKSEALNDTDTSSDTSSDDESVEQKGQKSTKATTGLVRAMQMTKSQQAVTRSSSSSSESSSEEDTVAKTPTGNVKGKAELGKESSCTGKGVQKSVGGLETNAESKQHVKSPAVNLSISETETASKKKKQKGKVLPTADMSAATEVSPSVTDGSATKKRRRGLSSAETSDLSSTDAKRSRQSTNMNSSANTLVHDTPVKSIEGNAEQVFGSASPNVLKSAEVVKNNGPYRRFTAGKDQLNQEFRDNSYRAKKGDAWGQKAYEDLAPVKGKNFRKEKTKKKRGSYKGGKIDPNAIGSIKFPDDDE